MSDAICRIFGQIFGQVFDQIFGQGFDQGLGDRKYSVQCYWDRLYSVQVYWDREIQCTVLPGQGKQTIYYLLFEIQKFPNSILDTIEHYLNILGEGE